MRLLSSAVLAAVAVAGLSSGVEAQSSRRNGLFVPPVIHGRSFLDSGRQVQQGSQSNYVTLSTTLNSPVYRTFAPDSFGQSALPSRFNNPGRSQPLARFYTPSF